MTEETNKFYETMNYFSDSFCEHPSENNLTFLEHLGSAWCYSSRSCLASFVFFVHGLFPMIFKETGSSQVDSLHSSLHKKNE